MADHLSKATVEQEGIMVTVSSKGGQKLATWNIYNLTVGRDVWRGLLECGEVEAANKLNGMLKRFEDRLVPSTH